MRRIIVIITLLSSLWVTAIAQTEIPEQTVTAKDIVDNAKIYYTEGWMMETNMALRQAWLMGEKDEVESFLRQHPIVMETIEAIGTAKHKPRISPAELFAIATKLDSLRFKEGKIIYTLFKKQAESEQAAWDYIKSKQDDSFVVFAMADIFEMDFDLKPLNDEGKRHYYQRAADMGCVLAYSGLAQSYLKGWMHDGKTMGIDIPKGIEYLRKAYDAGCLKQDCIKTVIRVLEEYPEVSIPIDMRRNLYRMEAIDIRYWMGLISIACKNE